MRAPASLRIPLLAILISGFAHAQTGQDPQKAPKPTGSMVGMMTFSMDENENYSPVLSNPAYEREGAVVLLDRGHRNQKFSAGTGQLLSKDGFQVKPLSGPLTFDQLRGVSVLVIINPGIFVPREPNQPRPSALMNMPPAFTEAEASAIYDWVAGGGSLLYAGNTFQSAGRDPVLERFGIEFSRDPVSDRSINLSDPQPGSPFRTHIFTAEQGLLGDHSILKGRSNTEQVKTVALEPMIPIIKEPKDAVPLLHGSDHAQIVRRDPLQEKEVKDAVAELKALPPGTRVQSSVGPAPVMVPAPSVPLASAFSAGKGKVVVVASGTSFSALTRKMTLDNKPITENLGLTEADNQQFFLNIMHWLSGSLQ